LRKRRRITIYLPESLLYEIGLVMRQTKTCRCRSEFIRMGMEHYVQEQKEVHRRLVLQNRLAVGYQMMGALNLELAAEADDDAGWQDYEQALAEVE